MPLLLTPNPLPAGSPRTIVFTATTNGPVKQPPSASEEAAPFGDITSPQAQDLFKWGNLAAGNGTVVMEDAGDAASIPDELKVSAGDVATASGQAAAAAITKAAKVAKSPAKAKVAAKAAKAAKAAAAPAV